MGSSGKAPLASRLADARGVAFYKATYGGGTPSDEHEIFLEPSAGSRFGGPVAVLTSDDTMSAAEALVMAVTSSFGVSRASTLCDDSHFARSVGPELASPRVLLQCYPVC